MKTILTTFCVFTLMFCVVAHAQEVEIAEEYAVVAEEPATVAQTTTSIMGDVSVSSTCTKGNLSRVVEITYGGEQGKAPCEVHYKKVTEDPSHDQVIYDAQHKSGYCEEKKQEFVNKLASWGWNCE